MCAEYVCQIWLRSDGRVEKKGGADRQTDKGTLQLYIVVHFHVTSCKLLIILVSHTQMVVLAPVHKLPVTA